MLRRVIVCGTRVVVATLVTLALPASARGAAAFSLNSSAFPRKGTLPPKYTCDGSDTAKDGGAADMNAGISPALQWQDPPAGTKAYALVVDDLDWPSGSRVHWLLFDIPATATALPEAVPKSETLADGSRHGRNDFRNPFYQGPCPPRGDPAHQYLFTLYALDAPTGLPAGASKSQLMQAIQKHTLATAELTGKYAR
ncbi:MAG: YbhB/YbcL family Raf kinase inhibitor-like protein [Deltaproteobacteria bacterium]|nr:YbhB/YbcL family Raf kinase inhibitor-like protein [Deltaproteobacteria bacterium]MBI3389550.1 YbhB/YbcL family Raf kinase inhibitor-like protein [Deltaproteobacteria bacterium]